MVRQTFEGTWEQIVAHAAELAGRHVRVTVFDDAPAAKQGLEQLMAGYVGSVTSDKPHHFSEQTKEAFEQIVEEKHNNRKQSK